MLQRLGPYTLVQQIAVGGMAEVYLAEGPGDHQQRQVAIKVIHPQSADDPQLIAMLIDEARLSVQLQHQNIVATYDLGQEGGEYYIVMEYVPGADLFRILRRAADLDESFPVEAAALVAREVAAGLDYAHRKRDQQGRPLQIIHRDISPQNVLLSPAGQVKLTDFGIAKAAHRTGQTRAGVIKGKYYYMSPEQAWGDPVDTRTDIFSAGILLYEMLVGQMLYLEDNLDHLVDAVRKADIVSPSQKRGGIPRDLEQIVMRALQKRPSDRWQTAGDYAQALTDFLRGYAPGYGAAELGGFIGRLVPERALLAQPVEPVAGPVVQADPNSLLFPVPESPEDLLGDPTSVAERPVKRALDQGTRALRDLELDEEPTKISSPLLDLPGVVSGRLPAQRLPVPRQERAETRKVSRPESWDETEGQPPSAPRAEGGSEPVQRQPERRGGSLRRAGSEQPWGERAATRKVPASALSPSSSPSVPSSPPPPAPPAPLYTPPPQQQPAPLHAQQQQQQPAPLYTPPPQQQQPAPLYTPPPPSPQPPPAPQAPQPVPAPQQFPRPLPAAPVYIPPQEQVPNYLAAAPPLPRWEVPTEPSLVSVSQQMVPARKPRRLVLAFLGAVVLGVAGVALVTLWPTETRQGQLEITSNPAGAVVQVDGAPMVTPTPVRLLNLDTALPHRISLSKPGYRTWNTEVRFEQEERVKAIQAVLLRDYTESP